MHGGECENMIFWSTNVRILLVLFACFLVMQRLFLIPMSTFSVLSREIPKTVIAFIMLSCIFVVIDVCFFYV